MATISNRTLLRRQLETVMPLLKQNQVHDIWVSTDHEIIAKEARDGGANIHWRDPHFATDTATSVSAVQEFMKSHMEVDIVILTQCTSPFLRLQYITDALSKLSSSSYNIQCIFSVTRVYKLRWKEIDARVEPDNFDFRNRPRRQDWRGELVENGMFYMATRKLINKGLLQDRSCYFVEIPEKDSLEIDSMWDLELARQILTIHESDVSV